MAVWIRLHQREREREGNTQMAQDRLRWGCLQQQQPVKLLQVFISEIIAVGWQ